MKSYTPTDDYKRESKRGWMILVSKELLANDRITAQACLELLDCKLLEISRVVPAGALSKIRSVPIWIEQNNPQVPGGNYHPSRDWLTNHGMNPDKAKAVDFGNAKNFLEWSLDQPMLVLHELAHAYHDQVLGFEDADIKSAYNRAKASGTYDSVLRSNGRYQKAYAMTCEKEYFAELTEFVLRHK